MKKSATILLVDHDVTTAVRLKMGLQDYGFRPLHATDGEQGLAWARAAQPDLVLLDTALPRMDGFAVCRTLRQESAVPIIMLSTYDRERDRVRGLEIGADDYVIKPFSPATNSGQSFRELVARVRALLRRRELDRRQVSPANDRIVVGDIVLDRTARQVWQAGQRIDMPQREFDLLRVLMENAGRAISCRELTALVWGEGWIGYPGTLKVHIYRLRKKLEADPSSPRYIQTVRRYGYRFVDPAALLTRIA